MNSLSEAVVKLERLSPERAGKVVALIEDLAELEALENEADLKAARATLAEPGQCISIDELEKRLGL